MELALILLTSIVWGISPIFDKIALKTVDPIMAVSLRMMTSGAILFIYLLFVNRAKNIVNISFNATMAIVISAILSGVLGYTFYFKALSNGTVSKIVPMIATYPLVAFIVAVCCLGETYSFTRLIGTILIVLGVMILNIK